MLLNWNTCNNKICNRKVKIVKQKTKTKDWKILSEKKKQKNKKVTYYQPECKKNTNKEYWPLKMGKTWTTRIKGFWNNKTKNCKSTPTNLELLFKKETNISKTYKIHLDNLKRKREKVNFLLKKFNKN